MPRISQQGRAGEGEFLEGLVEAENVTVREIPCKQLGVDLSDIVN